MFTVGLENLNYLVKLPPRENTTVYVITFEENSLFGQLW